MRQTHHAYKNTSSPSSSSSVSKFKADIPNNNQASKQTYIHTNRPGDGDPGRPGPAEPRPQPHDSWMLDLRVGAPRPRRRRDLRRTDHRRRGGGGGGSNWEIRGGRGGGGGGCEIGGETTVGDPICGRSKSPPPNPSSCSSSSSSSRLVSDFKFQSVGEMKRMGYLTTLFFLLFFKFWVLGSGWFLQNGREGGAERDSGTKWTVGRWLRVRSGGSGPSLHSHSSWSRWHSNIAVAGVSKARDAWLCSLREGNKYPVHGKQSGLLLRD